MSRVGLVEFEGGDREADLLSPLTVQFWMLATVLPPHSCVRSVASAAAFTPRLSSAAQAVSPSSRSRRPPWLAIDWAIGLDFCSLCVRVVLFGGEAAGSPW